MARAKGIGFHKVFKLGKARARKDPRTLQFSKLMKAPFDLVIPDAYDFDVKHSGIPTPMYANDKLGDCVIAGRAHHTLRFEVIEQNQIISISDQDVISEYFLETGGMDNGVVVLDSLNRWRNTGWLAADQQLTISAFAQINPANPDEVKNAIFMDVGVGIGLLLPKSAKGQIDGGQPWEVVDGSTGSPNSWGGHYVYVSGYTAQGPVCVTWGRKQQMTWNFLRTYCDEAYAVFDALNTKKLKEGLRVNLLTDFLRVNPPTSIAAPISY
ncbi:hypothetical protein [Spirosoma endophyticum]|uniref:Uncharacterized protein n=1 Tax=Spirosoma endophyticum TaxID=662367 RepID=A0A1I2GCL4_9BACT|nr:hypothetical protein [Spirosoma endophyticum]SFF15484.1 hypothetical protein SAMN05216167_13142 [Spirosoma endophyticum]